MYQSLVLERLLLEYSRRNLTDLSDMGCHPPMSARVLFYDVGKSSYFNILNKNSQIDYVHLVTSIEELKCALVDTNTQFDVLITNLVVAPETISLKGRKTMISMAGFNDVMSLAQSHRGVPVAVLSQFWHPDNVIAAYLSGARWFVKRRGLPGPRFIFDMLSVIEGAVVMPTGFDTLTVNRVRCVLDPVLKNVSVTDQELISELLRGVSTGEAIDVFGWKTPQHFYNRVSRVISKTGFSSRDELLNHCLAIGLVGVATNPDQH